LPWGNVAVLDAGCRDGPSRLVVSRYDSRVSADFNIATITAEQTRPLRQTVLRPGYAPRYSVYPGDDDPQTLHLGAVTPAGAVIAVASVYLEPLPNDGRLLPDAGAWRENESKAWRLRGMAVAEAYRGQGVGSALLYATFAAVRDRGGAVYWANARTSAVPFYTRHGLEPLTDEFDIPTVGRHFRMARRVDIEM